MKAYVDSSVLLRVLLGEPNPLKIFRKITLGISSEIMRVECLRVIDRIRLTAPLSDQESSALHQALHQSCAAMEFIKLSHLVLGMASQPFPTTVRTLDALHLASALLWSQNRELQPVFLTHDERLASAAKALGFTVDGV